MIAKYLTQSSYSPLLFFKRLTDSSRKIPAHSSTFCNKKSSTGHIKSIRQKIRAVKISLTLTLDNVNLFIMIYFALKLRLKEKSWKKEIKNRVEKFAQSSLMDYFCQFRNLNPNLHFCSIGNFYSAKTLHCFMIAEW